MRKRFYLMILAVMLIGVFAAVTAQAQSTGRTELIANIPFAFNVDSKTLPAGEYTVREVNPGSDKVLLLRSKDGRSGAMVQVISVIGKTPESTKLIFRRYGNHYFFAQAWVVGDNSGLEAPKSRSERATQRELASIKLRTEEVALISRAN